MRNDALVQMTLKTVSINVKGESPAQCSLTAGMRGVLESIDTDSEPDRTLLWVSFDDHERRGEGRPPAIPVLASQAEIVGVRIYHWRNNVIAYHTDMIVVQ